MANLRPKTTGLPFTVYISERGNAWHAPRVKVCPAPHARREPMSSYAIRPFRHVAGPRLDKAGEEQLARWVALNAEALLGY